MLIEICAAFILGQVPQSNDDLRRFSRLNFASLSNPDRAELAKFRDRLMPPGDLNMQSKLVNEWVKSEESGVVRFVFTDLYTSADNPVSGFVKGCCLDEHMNVVAAFRFATGYLLAPNDQQWVNGDTPQRAVLQLRMAPNASTSGLAGGKGRSVFFPASGLTEYYTFDSDGPHLIRLEDSRGRLMPNNYTNVQNLILPDKQTLQMTAINYLDLGPSIFGRSAADWKAELLGDDWSRQLEFLVWLGGRHRSSPDTKESDLGQESADDDNTFKSLTQDKDVQQRIRLLAESPRRWIGAQAAFTLSRITTMGVQYSEAISKPLTVAGVPLLRKGVPLESQWFVWRIQ